MEDTVNFYIEKLLEYFDVHTISELALKIDVQQPVISGWKARNSINPIKKKCRELGIYNEIFGDINTQKIKNNHGQIAQNMSGNQTFTSSQTSQDNEIEPDPATYNLFLEAYQKAIKNDDLKGLRLHLMDY